MRVAVTSRNEKLVRLSIAILKSHYFIELGKGVRIGPGLLLPHPMAIVIGNKVVLGKDLTLGQNVTIGANFKRTRDIDRVKRKTSKIGD